MTLDAAIDVSGRSEAGPAVGIELSECSSGAFEARGRLTFATARRARELGLTAFGASGVTSIEVDCSGITAADSAGLAVLLDWLAFAKQTNRRMKFATLPPQTQAIARITDVLEMLERGVQPHAQADSSAAPLH